MKPIKSDERGVVAIIVAVLLMTVLSLIVLATSQNSTREQRETIDRQLSDQAFYNAETGINDVANYLYTTRNDPSVPTFKDTCADVPALSRDIDGAGGPNKYTCVQYDKAPKTIQYDKLSTSEPKVVPILTVSDNPARTATNLVSLTISWDDAGNRDNTISGACNFTDGATEFPNNCTYAGIRAEIVSPAETRDLIKDRAFSVYALPGTGAPASVSVAGVAYPDSQGIYKAASCNGAAGTRRCSITINDINRNSLVLTLRSLYQPANVTISGRDSANNELRFKDSQVMIDSTGRSSDILRRVQVRIPGSSQYNYPGFALQTKDSICKVYNVIRDDASERVESDNTAACPIN